MDVGSMVGVAVGTAMSVGDAAGTSVGAAVAVRVGVLTEVGVSEGVAVEHAPATSATLAKFSISNQGLFDIYLPT